LIVCSNLRIHAPQHIGVQEQLHEARSGLLYGVAAYFGTRNLVLHATVVTVSTKLLQSIVSSCMPIGQAGDAVAATKAYRAARDDSRALLAKCVQLLHSAVQFVWELLS
jgi:hypothetical protein